MDVILHLGAHRTATGSFQDYLRRHGTALAAEHIGVWGPRRASSGLYSRVLTSGAEADLVARRISRRLDRAQALGVRQLLVTDANMLGTVAANIRRGALYPDAGQRLSRFAQALSGRVTSVLICPRSLELYWCSALASGVQSGVPVPERTALRRIALARRGWRDVISDIAAALPGVRLRVLPFERYAGVPRVLLHQALGCAGPADTMRELRNAAPTLPELRRSLNAGAGAVLPFGMGRWNPFLNDEHAALRELYADDLMWLAAGADGVASLTEDRSQNEAGTTLPLRAKPKGRCDELQERKLARPG